MGLLAAALASVAFLHAGNLVVLNPKTGAEKVVLRHASGPVAWSGDGKLVSAGGRIAGGPRLPAPSLEWAPTGERAAYQTSSGAVVVWSRRGGKRTVVPGSWGAVSFAWGPGGRLALGRKLDANRHQEVWVWRAGKLRRVVGPLPRVRTPFVAGFTPDGRVLWWDDVGDSASLAADGLELSAGTKRLATTLVFPDFVVPCGRKLALVAGGDRNTTHGKSILLGGRDVSRDRTRSWISPSCSADGKTLVAAAGRDRRSGPWGREHRAIWRLLPKRRRLTIPPAGWTDESPHVLADGSILFVRTRLDTRGKKTLVQGRLMRLAHGKLRRLADLSETLGPDANEIPMFYGHYWWPRRLAVAPGA